MYDDGCVAPALTQICSETEAKTVMYFGSAEKEKWVTEDNIAEIRAKVSSFADSI